VKRLFITTFTAMALFGALGSAARAQTATQRAKWNSYLSNRPGATQQFGTNSTASNVPNYMNRYSGTTNGFNPAYAAYQGRYQRDLATYDNYLATHPGIMAQPGMMTGLPYGGSYPGMAYGNPMMQQLSSIPMMQQLSSIPIVSSLAPMLGGYGGYSGGMPMGGMPYAAASYPYSAPSYPYAQAGGMLPPWAHHHHWFNNPYATGSGASGIGYPAMGTHSGFFASHPYAAARHARWLRNH